MELEKDPKIEFTLEELREAVGCYELLLPSEIEAAYNAMLAVPQFGLKIAQALQFAAKAANKAKMGADRILDAAVVPAFLVGMLVGIGKPKPLSFEAPTFDEQMEMLKQCVGKPVAINCTVYGMPRTVRVRLLRIDPYAYLAYESAGEEVCLSFVGQGVAIRQVAADPQNWFRVVYMNPKIPLDYDVREEGDVEHLKAICFGPLPPLKKKA